MEKLSKRKGVDFPGGAVDRNLPANAGDTGLIPSLERFHMTEQLSLCATTTEAKSRN